MKAGLLPIFGMTEISILSGIRSLWREDILLAGVVFLFALIAPILKTLALMFWQFGKSSASVRALTGLLSKLAMADIFLIALYITAVKGVGVGKIALGWGFYLFLFCVLSSLIIYLYTSMKFKRIPLP